MDGRTDNQTDERTDRQKDGKLDSWTYPHLGTEGQTNQLTYGWKRTDRQAGTHTDALTYIPLMRPTDRLKDTGTTQTDRNSDGRTS